MKLPALSLKYRIALVIFVLEAMMMSVVLWQSLGMSLSASKDLHQASEDVLLEVVDQIAETALLTEEYSEVQLYVAKLGKQPTVSRILVTDIRDRIVVSSETSDIGKPLPDFQDQPRLFWRSIPVDSPAGPLGTLAIQFNTSAIDEAADQALKVGASIAFVGMITIAVVGIFVGYALTRRLERLALAATGFARGDRSVRSGIDGEDEIGELGRTFDSMIEQVSTEQIRLEQQVRARTVKLHEQADIINQINDSVIAIDLQGDITNWNKGAEQQLGYTTEQAIGRHVSDLLPDNEHDRLKLEVMEPALRDGGLEIELPLLRKGGSEFPAHLSLSVLHDEDGKPKGFVGIATDITERRKNETELKQALSRLAVANEELESFSYSVSHDLRSPLRAVDGFSHALQEEYAEQFDETGRDYLQRVRAGTQRMGKLIDDLLQLSRLSRKKLEREDVDITAIAQLVVEELRASEPDRSVTVNIEQGLKVKADPGLMRAVLENLIGNAWKYTGNELKGEINIGRQSSTGQEVLFVKDNGVGFDMQYAGKLFGAFQRLHKADEFPGTGIGLATVKRIIIRHNGKVWAESQEGIGSTFYFTLT